MADTQTAERTQALAHLKFARVGPRKLRRVADAIRGKTVREALILLKFSGVFASEPLEKLLRSAVANAENNHNMATDDLYVSKITVDSGPGGGFTKRLDPRAQGRAAFKRKRMSHVTIAVSGTPPKKAPRQRAGASIAMSTRETRRAAAATPAKTSGAKKSGGAKKASSTKKKSAAAGASK
ncbi:MAG: 50S ribosomal protein L22 [Candidatus Eremiobacteraeota bacterium]|nr:50S ribosomal protein L22 [Candidatus Eremiobacteraeota bacterium]